ncbi:MAG: HEAT repeat domain-containing protein [Planctomycetaceae bacterium]
MDILTSNADLIPCPYCGHQLRKGMVRCRECNAVISEDFVLADSVATAARKCERCGTLLEPGTSDCPCCAAAMLDQLLNAPPPQPVAPAPAPPRFVSGVSKLREFTPRPSLPNRSVPAEPRRASEEESATDVLFESETDSSPVASPRPTPAPANRVAEPARDESPPAPVIPDTTDACLALTMSLSSDDIDLRCQAATALGKLGNKMALTPLERLLGDPDVRARRAAAEALIELGHPKGASLRKMAERQPAGTAPTVPAVPAAAPKPTPARQSTNWGALAVPAVAAAALALVGGGVWWWMSSPPGTSSARTVPPPSSSPAPGVAAAPAPATPAPAAAEPQAAPAPASKPVVQTTAKPAAPATAQKQVQKPAPQPAVQAASKPGAKRAAPKKNPGFQWD